MVWPHLENCIQAWSPYLQKDIQRLESVQRAATKLVACLRNLSYDKRLQAIWLTSLYDRRLTGDLIETFKILYGFERLSSHQFFQSQSSGYCIRGHSMKFQVQRSRLDTRKYFFQSTCYSALELCHRDHAKVCRRVLRGWWHLMALVCCRCRLYVIKQHCHMASDVCGWGEWVELVKIS